MLLGQDFGRSHQGHVEAAFDRHERAAGRDHSFARADLSLHQPSHRVRAAQIAAQLAQHSGLGCGEFEIEQAQKRFDQPIVAAAGQSARLRLEILSPPLDGHLQVQKLVEGQALSSLLRVGQFLWEVQLTHRFRPRGQRRQDETRPRFPNLVLEASQRPPDQPAQPALGHPFGQRVNRSDAVDVNKQLVARFNHFGFRMIDDARLDRFQLAENHDLVVHGEIFLHERQVPPPAMQPASAVFEDKLKNRFGALPVGLEALSDDASASRGRSPHFELADAQEMPAVFVAPRPMQQQLLDGEQSEPGQLRGSFRPDAGQRLQRSRERKIWSPRHKPVYSGSSFHREAGSSMDLRFAQRS